LQQFVGGKPVDLALDVSASMRLTAHPQVPTSVWCSFPLDLVATRGPWRTSRERS